MIYIAYWRNKADRIAHHGYDKANTHDEAYDLVQGKLQKGCRVEAVYEASESDITPQSITINFPNTTDYTRFG